MDEGKRFDKEVMLVFQNHCDVKSEGEHRKQVAKDDLKRLSYRNKTTFSIDKYITRNKQTYNVLENYNVPLYEEDKVGQLLDNINCPNHYLKFDVKINRYIHSASLETAFRYLSTAA